MVDSSKLRGWKFDNPNTYGEVWVNGTKVATFDDAAGGGLTLPTNGITITAGGLTVTAGGLTVTDSGITQSDATNSTTTVTGSLHTDGGVGITKNTFIGGSMVVTGNITYYDRLYHAGATIEAITGDKTLDAQDTGKIMTSAVDSAIFTLPATVAGLTFMIVNAQTADSTVTVKIQPNTADQIYMPDILTDSDNGIVNTGASSKIGDYVILVGNGTTGWVISEMAGTWAAESG
jgi:hypothetical protein